MVEERRGEVRGAESREQRAESRELLVQRDGEREGQRGERGRDSEGEKREWREED